MQRDQRQVQRTLPASWNTLKNWQNVSMSFKDGNMNKREHKEKKEN